MFVKCPNCKTKFERDFPHEEFCGICESIQTFKEVKSKVGVPKKTVKKRK